MLFIAESQEFLHAGQLFCEFLVSNEHESRGQQFSKLTYLNVGVEAEQTELLKCMSSNNE